MYDHSMLASYFTLFSALATLTNGAAIYSNTTTAQPSLTSSCSDCTIYGGNVQVYWWPTASDGQQIMTKEVDANNFTFISPSVYVAFSTLYTGNLCGTGSALPATTIAFLENELSTATGWRWNIEQYTTRPPRVDSAFILATWGNKVLSTCDFTTTSFLQPVDGPYQNDSFSDAAAFSSSYGTIDPGSLMQYTVSYNPCSPTLSAPREVFTIEPSWASCVRGIEGFFDPPYALSVDNGLLPVTTTSKSAQPVASPTTFSAVPQSIPAPATVTPTTASQAAAPSPTTQSTVIANNPPPADPTTQPAPVVNSPSPDPKTQPTTVADPPSPDPVNQSTTIASNDPPATDPTTQSTTVANNDPAPAATNLLTTTTPFVIIGSQTVTAGSSSVLVSGTPISLQADGSSIVIGSSTIAPGQALTQIAGLSTVTAAASLAYVIGGQTLTPGAPGITITDSSGASSVVSLEAGGSSVVIGGSTKAPNQVSGLSTVTQATAAATQVLDYVIGSQTLTPGASGITITDTSGAASVVSLEPGGSSVVVGGKTIAIGQLSISGLHTVTEAPTSKLDYVVGIQTLVPGGSGITITDASDATSVISLLAGGSSVVVGGKTIPVSQLSVSGLHTITESVVPTKGIGGIVLSVGGYPTTTTTSDSYLQFTNSPTGYNGTLFTGDSSYNRKVGRRIWVLGIALIATVLY